MATYNKKTYISLLTGLKKRIASARIKAALAVNSELIHLYWDIGKSILAQQKKKGWGAKVTETLSKDLRKAFADMKGLSKSNLDYMQRFAETYPHLFSPQPVGKIINSSKPGAQKAISPQAVGKLNALGETIMQLPWGHNRLLMEKLSTNEERQWYANHCVQHGWSRNVFAYQIESGLYHRQEKKGKSTNFKKILSSPQSELAEQTIKDPYIFDFLNISKKHNEKELEDKLMEHITRFLIELGSGFSFVGRQYNLKVGKEDFHIDLLFFHIRLKCYIVVELKIDKFRPEYAGQLSFYLSAVDGVLKQKDHNPTIGILLCPAKNKVVVEYALQGINSPIGVSEYEVSKNIPERLRKELAGINELKEELEQEIKRESSSK
jgi:predicted nuclease of restriction endonuclease-like (RecB) superfamily